MQRCMFMHKHTFRTSYKFSTIWHPHTVAMPCWSKAAHSSLRVVKMVFGTWQHVCCLSTSPNQLDLNLVLHSQTFDIRSVWSTFQLFWSRTAYFDWISAFVCLVNMISFYQFQRYDATYLTINGRLKLDRLRKCFPVLCAKWTDSRQGAVWYSSSTVI